MKRIHYAAPVDYMQGSLASGRKFTYGAEAGNNGAYAINIGERVAANDYAPILVTKYNRKCNARFFQIRTRSTVNMTAEYKRTLAIMGGACAIYSAIVREKSDVYKACLDALPAKYTMRAYIIPIIRNGLAAYADRIQIGNMYVVNPWVSSETPNIQVKQDIIDKFANQLSNI